MGKYSALGGLIMHGLFEPAQPPSSLIVAHEEINVVIAMNFIGGNLIFIAVFHFEGVLGFWGSYTKLSSFSSRTSSGSIGAKPSA